MNKNQHKAKILKKQKNQCALSGVSLPSTNLALTDRDRITTKAENGPYTDENTRVAEPRAHMRRHGILREREATIDQLKSLFDDRVQMMKLIIKENNQLLAYQRRVDSVNPETEAFLQEHLKPIQSRLGAIDREIEKLLPRMNDKLVTIALAVPGVGPITVAALTVYVDLVKSSTPTALWQYIGLDRPSHERYLPNPDQQARRKARGPAFYGSTDAVPTGWGGNKTLRTVLWNTANVMVRQGGEYRKVYDQTKQRLEQSEKITKTRNTDGKLVERPWKDTKPSHRHGAALRAIMKHLTADYWMVGRTVRGLSTTPLYVEAMLGHTHIISPLERGWTFDIPAE